VGWTIYLDISKNLNGSLDENILKDEIEKICSRQIKIPGSEPLWTTPGINLDRLPGEQLPNYKRLSYYFSKIQSSLNPFLSIVLTIMTAKKLSKKFGDEIHVSIHDDLELPIKKIEDYLWIELISWTVLGILFTPIWLIVLLILKFFRFS
jgi:hypothetical protein